MPLMINGVSYNKPIRNGKILNALHADHHTWLQNHWTGTPNASASTLSLDGNVVATNQATDPTSISTLKDIVCASSSNGFTLTRNTAYTGSDDNNLVCANLVKGSPYHFHAELVSAHVTSPSDFAVWSRNLSLPNSVLAGGAQTFDMDFMGLDNTFDNLRFSFKTGKAVGDTVTWRNVGIYSASDWAAMQALGVNWFSGDIYEKEKK